jgi:proteic killer suppression protein
MDANLGRLVREPDFCPAGWHPGLIRVYRRAYQLIRGAIDVRDLWALRSLGLEQLSGDSPGSVSIRLSEHCRLLLDFKSDGEQIAVLVAVVDCH